jgi:peptide chain release factor 2
MEKPAFWEKPQRAAELQKERAGMVQLVERFQGAEKRLQDAGELLELALEEGDPAVLGEIDRDLDGLAGVIRALELERMLSGPHDAKNAFLSINAGAGGTESCDWAEMLFRMYLRYSERRGWRTHVTDYLPGDEAGIKSATITVEGDMAFGYLRAEIGIHRLVRISPYDAAKRRHTSFASVFVYPELDDDIEIEIRDEDLRVDTYRSSGAGGQHVNKTDSAVRLTHHPSGIVVACQAERSQHKNKSTAMKLLRAKLYDLEMQKRQAELDAVNATKKEISFGSQIRSYVLQPYRMVKDHRTELESPTPERVLDGDLEAFIEAYLIQAGNAG